MGIYIDTIQDRVASAVGKLQLDGARSGAASLYTAPATAKGIISVTPYVMAAGTLTANDLFVATLRITSTDFKNFNPDYEVFCPPIFTGSAVAPIADTKRVEWPMMWPLNGGETMEFDAIVQSAPTGSYAVGADIKWTDDASQIVDGPFGARAGGTPGSNAALTSTGTSATSVTGTTITISGVPKTIRTIQAILAPQGVTSLGIAGWGTMAATEILTQRFAYDPVDSVVALAQGSLQARLTRKDYLNIPVNPTPSSIINSLQVTRAPSAAGVFAAGVIYS